MNCLIEAGLPAEIGIMIMEINENAERAQINEILGFYSAYTLRANRSYYHCSIRMYFCMETCRLYEHDVEGDPYLEHLEIDWTKCGMFVKGSILDGGNWPDQFFDA